MNPSATKVAGGDRAETDARQPIGIARLSKLAFDGADLKPLWNELVDRYVTGAADAATLMDMATLRQLFGDVEGGVACQLQALAHQRLYRSPRAATPSLRLLALAAPGDIGANTPLEFLLEGSDVALDTCYVVSGQGLPPGLQRYDLAIVTAGESDANIPVLEEIARLTAGWPIPVLNDPLRIAGLSRERVPALLKGAPNLLAPPTARVARARLQHLAAGTASVADLLGSGDFPLIVRPVDSHAGRGLARIADRSALAPYLAERAESRFFVAPFIDYSGADGLFRKYRIAFIGGRAYACHLAIADQWMIYYLNAGMRESEAKRAEEAQFMRDFDADFARRHAGALAAIAERIGLEYFAIDCAETRDGRLLLFEADIAMIVHAMDPADIFPYKGPQMRKLFDGFAALLRQRAGSAA